MSIAIDLSLNYSTFQALVAKKSSYHLFQVSGKGENETEAILQTEYSDLKWQALCMVKLINKSIIRESGNRLPVPSDSAQSPGGPEIDRTSHIPEFHRQFMAVKFQHLWLIL